WKERILLKHSIFIPETNFLPELLKRKGKGELAAKCVAIGTDMTQDRETLVLAQHPADFLELGICHRTFVATLLWAVFENVDNGLGLTPCRAVATAFTCLRCEAFRFLAESQ